MSSKPNPEGVKVELQCPFCGNRPGRTLSETNDGTESTKALRRIKALVVGEKHPYWDSDWAVTNSRGLIADECDRALSEPAAPEWQPIETAPEDGQAILGYSPAYEGVLVFAINGRAHSWWTPGLSHMPADNAMFPTHWMPLPNPPDGEEP